ncbi:hypothetical protein [Janthinobacterium sp. PSPC2-1]|uniref:hypothetical protein n=1 Tax=Janthinobacterium sp. PSPC2-1 TaxID=2804585 RepID=UPI003CF8CCA0
MRLAAIVQGNSYGQGAHAGSAHGKHIANHRRLDFQDDDALALAFRLRLVTKRHTAAIEVPLLSVLDH